MPRARAVADETVLPAIMFAFWRGGYASTGVRELEAASGLKAPSLYHRFGSKDAAFEAALAHYIEVVVGQRVQRYLRAHDPVRGLRAFFESTYAHDQRPLGCLLVNSALEHSAAQPGVTAQLERGQRIILRELRANLRRVRAAGRLRPNADIDTLADVLQLGLTGLLLSCRAQRDKASLERQTRALLAILPWTASARRKDMP